MRLQHVSPLPFGQNGDHVTAVQHNFAEAVVHSGLKDRNPNRTFAAPMPDISVADGTDLGYDVCNVRSFSLRFNRPTEWTYRGDQALH